MADYSVALNPNAPKPESLVNAYGEGLKLKALAMQPEVIQQELAASRQNVAASQTAQAAQQAGIPSIEAKAALDMQTAQYQAWVKEKKVDFTKKDAKGEPMLDEAGNPMVDINSLIQGSMNAGYQPQAFEAARLHLENTAKNIKNAGDLTKESKDLAGTTALLLRGKEPEKIPQVLAMIRVKGNALYPGLGDSVVATFGKDPTQEDINRVAEASQGVTEAAATDISKRGMSVTEAQLPINQAVETRAATKAELDLKLTAGELISKQGAIGRGVKAGGQVLKIPTYFGEKLSVLFEKYAGTDGNIRTLQQAVQAHNSAFPDRPIDLDSPIDAGTISTLTSSQADLTPRINEFVKAGGKVTQKTTKDTNGKVHVKNSAGKTGWIPKVQLPEALSSGYTVIQ